MTEQLEQALKALPEAPGIYQMLDKHGNIIYIGKSKCLKKRVQSYFVPSPVWDKAKEMAPFIVDLKIIVTDTHLEAMLLECERIKKIKPYFNAMMKNDKKYAFLTLEENYRRNPLKITSTRESASFGPFRSRSQLQDIIDTLRNLYPIHKNGSKYEVAYHIFPCTMDVATFAENRQNLLKILSSKTAMQRFVSAIRREMKASAQREEFEQAQRYKEILAQITHLQKQLNRFALWQETELIYAVPLQQGYKLFYIAGGQIIHSQTVTENTAEVRAAFLAEAKQRPRAEQSALNEKELLDYRDIVYTELAGAGENVYVVE